MGMRYSEGARLHPSTKEMLTGKNEFKVKKILNSLGMIEEKDFRHQYPISGTILDFAFPEERVGIESDGKKHFQKKNKKKDYERDYKLSKLGWVIIRVPDDKMTSYEVSFTRSLIKEVLKEKGRVLCA